MRNRSIALAGALFLLSAIVARSDAWTTLQGRTTEGQLTGVYGEILVISTPRGSATLVVNDLDDASLLKVAAFLATPAAPPQPWKRSSSALTKSLGKKLQVLKDGKLVAYDPGDRPEPEFYLAYYGALWCGPCRRFSPQLVSAYQQLKPMAPDRFEVIFISDDTDAGEQLKYAREVGMPWPMLEYRSVESVPIFEQWRAGGIPCLVVFTRDGDMLFHSYRGKEYLGANDPLEKFSALLAMNQGGSTRDHNAGRHRLAVAQHILAAAGGNLPPKPYRVSISPALIPTLPGSQLTAQISLDAKGRVTEVEFSPQLGAVQEDELKRAADDWLFLPSVVQGQPKAITVSLPISLGKKEAAH